MSMNYRLADMLSVIRNGQAARLAKVRVQASNLVGNAFEVLKNEGFIADYKRVEEGAGDTAGLDRVGCDVAGGGRAGGLQTVAQ